METQITERVLIKPNDLVKVTVMNHIVEVQHMEKWNFKANIKKLDKDTYLEISTGEIKEFEHSMTRKDNQNSLRQSFKKLRYLVNNNFVGAPNELHLTLTYAENMTDPKQLYTDFDKFWKRLKYHFRKETKSIDYLNVVEPQERGAWHCHCLVRFNDLEKVYIPNETLRELWGNGFVKIRSLKDVDNIGAYLSAYLSDIELTKENINMAITDEKLVTIRQVDGQEKKFIKGGRLHLYPPGMNIQRSSKGIVHPERTLMKYKDRKKIVGLADPHYTKTIAIETEDHENKITYEQYNMKRKI